ncbi:MAG: LAGLIDADG family homing endonuclease [bacterium]
MLDVSNKKLLSYIIGIAIGDGNLSNPNGRAVRLRVTCDVKYPKLINKISKSIKAIAPNNSVALVFRKQKNAIDVSCYSNDWEKILGWKAKGGSKINQKISVPDWIIKNKEYSKNCLQGLFQTDGSIYKDRKYLTVNFVSHIPSLARKIYEMIEFLGYNPHKQIIEKTKNNKYTIRVSKDINNFIKTIKLTKY